MKKINSLFTTLLLTASVFVTQHATAQAPQKMSYQSVLRNSGNVLLASKQVGIKISVLQGTVSGNAVYTETQTPTTNANGLVSLQIGTGANQTGTFAGIDWAAGPYFIKTETDPAGGTTYTITGTQELLSVPYALHAKTADNLTGATTLTIGQSYQGGIICWLDATGQHGLIAATADQSEGIQWSNGVLRITGAAGDGLGAGAMNTAMIVATQMADNQTGNFAAKVCADYSVTVDGVTYGDWYLPSKYELSLLGTVGGFANNYYWSSTESSSSEAWVQQMFNGGVGSQGKFVNNYRVRAVRAF